MQLTPYFQPIIDISTAQVIGHETLARIIDTDGSARSAGSLFFDKSKDSRDTLQLDREVRRQAIEKFSKAQHSGMLTLNIMPEWIDLLEGDVIPTIEMLKQYNVDPNRVVVEIIETDSDSERLATMVRHYKNYGMKVAIDDFGSGASQFDRVIKLEPDIIKLDMRFVKEAVKGGFSQHIAHSLSHLAERMGSEILCEGVESYDEFCFAMEIGCKLVQGFMFSSAKESFTDEAHYHSMVSRQRKQYLDERLQVSATHTIKINSIREKIEELSKKLKDHIHQPLSAEHISIIDENICRIFVCDDEGTQISPHYRINQNDWQTSQSMLGANWCWKPFFCQLLSSTKDQIGNAIVSNAYHDLEIGTIKTVACRIDDKRVLMADIK